MNPISNENGARIQFVRDLCPDLSEEELKAAEDRLARYLMLALEIHAAARKDDS